MRDRIEINKDLVPYSFSILLADQWFELFINYNETADLFTVSLYKDEELICTEPVVYAVPLFRDLYQPETYPDIEIVPFDESGQNCVVTFDNFNELVYLVIDDEEEELPKQEYKMPTGSSSSSGSGDDSGVTVTYDGVGHVTVESTGNWTVTDDGEGNVVVKKGG